jgi:type I restriction enzyme S subunit
VDFDPFQGGEFVDSKLGKIPKGWEAGTLKDICQYSIKRIDVSSLTKENYISTENMLPNRAGYTSATNLPSLAQTTMFNEKDVLISNIRPYFKKLVYCDSIGGCSTDVLCLTPYSPQISSFLFHTVYTDIFFDYMVASSKGTKMPRGDKNHIMNYSIVIPSNDEITRFADIVNPMLVLKSNFVAENMRLANIRDTLLPRLMSGEIEADI